MLLQQLHTIAKCHLSRISRSNSQRSRGRSLRLETLETRQLLASDAISLVPTDSVVEMQDQRVVSEPLLQNPAQRYDVNNDGIVTVVDALIVINSLNRNDIRELPLDNPQAVQRPFTDVSGDGVVTSIDALQVINFLGVAHSKIEGEVPSTVVGNETLAHGSETSEHPRLELHGGAVTEEAGFVELTVDLSSPSSEVVSAAYRTYEYIGTARPGTDYVPTSGQLIFQPGEQQKTIRIQIVDDQVPESEETFCVELLDVAGAAAGQAPAGNLVSVTIAGNDTLATPNSHSKTDFEQTVDSVFSEVLPVGQE